jgi:glycosyltransferase involved in cell wall biosynthesis
MSEPKLLVFSSLFPSQVRPNAGVFIRERMFRVGKYIPIIVVSPVPWFPFQEIIRYWCPQFRPQPSCYEEQEGVQVYYPRFFSIPGLLKSCDGFFMAVGALPTLLKLKKKFTIIDAHFAYPDGYAATLLGKWLNKPVTITLRGTEVPLAKIPRRKEKLLTALVYATQVFSVSDSLKQFVVSLGANGDKIQVIGNGIDVIKFQPIAKSTARAALSISEGAMVLVSVGALVDRKGFHRVIDLLPELVSHYPNLIYLIVGGDSPEGNIRIKLERQVEVLNLKKHVRFLGAYSSDQLKVPLSAANLFVLATANEGWANVFLEAMACGLPVITTDVGGNKEVIVNSELGTVVPFADSQRLLTAISNGLDKSWNISLILKYAQNNAWDYRVKILVDNFNRITSSF